MCMNVYVCVRFSLCCEGVGGRQEGDRFSLCCPSRALSSKALKRLLEAS